MESDTKAFIWVAALFAVLILGLNCNNTVVQAQQEKTKQLQILQSMQMYQSDYEPRFQRQDFNNPENFKKS